jgi:protochlorophyllide reductase
VFPAVMVTTAVTLIWSVDSFIIIGPKNEQTYHHCLVLPSSQHHHPYQQSFLRSKNLHDEEDYDDDDHHHNSKEEVISNSPLFKRENRRPMMDRRRALASTTVAALSLWLGLKTTPAWASDLVEEGGSSSSVSNNNNNRKKTILITGCNSGIGFEASRILARQGNTVIMACRTMEKATDSAQKILSETPSAKLIPAECNLASLESIRRFVQDTASKVEGGVDVVCYNAGLCLNTDDPNIQRTVDGFELTVGTNHLGHFYLHQLLLPTINKSNGRIVITASGVHDPDSPGGGVGKTATLGNLEGFERDGKNFEMVDGQTYNGDKAYKDSKLCNVLFCRELQRRLSASDSTRNMSANAFSPGLITSGGFFRYQNPLFSSVFNIAATKILGFAETPQWGGAALAYTTTVDTKGEFYNSPPGSSKSGDEAFGREFVVYEVSKEAKDDAKAKRLWELSEGLVGIQV